MKTCSRCKVSKPLESYSKLASSRDGLQSKCKQCFSEYNRQRYQAKGEEIRAKVNARARRLGKDLYEKYQREYLKEYYQKNKERINKRNAEYAKNNREVRRGIKARYRTQLVQGMSALDRRKSTLHRKRIKDNPCYYCGRYRTDMHDDHYYPIGLGGTDHWFNIVRACSECNFKKSKRLARDFIF